MGTAFLHYNFLKNNNTKITMAFEVDPNKIGTQIGDVMIYDLAELQDRLREEAISVVILTVPAGVAQEITDRLEETGVKGILNLSPARLNIPASMRVHHIDLAVELESLIYFLKNYPDQDTESSQE